MSIRRALLWGFLAGATPAALFVVGSFVYGVLRYFGNRREGW